MKRLSIHSASCSCTSCVYRSRSKQPSVQQLIDEGSRIDKLYYGKYLPLRERKLLEKLIRTRAVYDDVRNQLLSTSGSSDQTRSTHKIKGRDDDSTEKSGAVLKIVDLVDRGKIGSSNTSKLSSCCSCCSCSSLRKIKKHMAKHPPKVHRHHVPYENIARYTVEAEKRGRKRRRRLSAKISRKIRSVQFKIKQIRSEPCTCTLSLSSVIKRPSKEFIKKVRSKERAIANTQAQKVVTIERKAIKKKICSCSCKIAKFPMKSIQKIKNIRKSGTKDSGTEMGHQRAFRIKKDSITLFREKLLKKRVLKDWECEPGICVVDECIPEHCIEKIKARGVGGTKRRKYHNRITGTGRDRNRISISTRPVKVKRTDSRVQATPKSILGPVACECKPTSKSASSMTSFSKSRSLVKIQSIATHLKVKKPKSAKRKAQFMLKETYIKKKEAADRYAPKQTESSGRNQSERVHTLPKSNLGHVICECKPSTKSTSSMTTILKKRDLPSVSKTEIKIKRPITPKARPKIVITKEKAYKKGLREKEQVKVSPKSNLGHVICECKPSTKTTASQMQYQSEQSVSKLKTKIKPKEENPLKLEKVYKKPRYKPKRKDHYKYEISQEPDKQAVKISSSFKFEIEFSKNKYPALTNKELIERVYTKRAKRIKSAHSKNKHRQKYHHSKVQVTGAPQANHRTKSSQENQISYLRETASQASKPFRKMVLPFPRECDPLMCIPYECDPENCARILLSRSKSRGRPAGSNTDRLRRKSAGSTTSSLKTSSKSRYVQSRSTESFITNHSLLSKPKIVKYDQSEISSHPQKQAVRLTSNFSFNIEFYKESAPGLKTDATHDHYNSEYKIVNEVPRKKYREKGHRARNINTRHISSQSRSSQSFKNVQVGHRLKRCFCTLKLVQKRNQIIKHVVSKKTMASLDMEDKRARIRETQTKLSGISYVIPPVTSHPAALLSYECEPSFCSPGKCNPYLCAERIKVRNRNEANYSSRETYTASTPRKSTQIFTSQDLSKSSSRKIQSSGNKIKKLKTKRSHAPRLESRVSSENKQKQAVRIGSSYSFHIEFSKEKNDQNSHQDTVKEFVSVEPLNKGNRHIQHKGIKVYKPRVRPTAINTTKNVKAKQNNTTPFLQKCFCTLKLFKKNKRSAETEIPRRNRNEFIVQMQNKSITSNRANVAYNYEQLLPYECQPGICVPDKCDPYYCKDLIKLRHFKLQNTYSNTDDLITRSSFSETSRTITSSKSRNTQSYTKKSKENAKRTNDTDRNTNELNITPSHGKRRAVRVGSNFNFNIEFYKEKPSVNNYGEYVKTQDIVPIKQKLDGSIKKHSHKKDKLRAIGSQELNPHFYHKAINAEAKRKEKRIYVSSAIKRCFCTLMLNKKGKNVQQEKHKVTSKSTKASYPLQNPQICDCKSTSTKTSYPLLNHQICDCKSTSTKISRPVNDLRSKKCAPDICISGMCNPLECYEEIKQSPDRQIGIDRHKRRSISSMTTSVISESLKPRTFQSRFLKQTSVKDYKVRLIQKDVRPTSSISPSRQTVRIGSNFSFNVEFFKDSFKTSVPDTINFQTEKYVSIKKNDKGTKENRLALKNRLTQANNIRKDKASNVGFLLKRCFCTLGLQKKNINLEVKKPKRELRWNPPITTQFVQVVHVDQNKKKKSNFVVPVITGRSELKEVNDISDKSLYRRESLKLSEEKLSGGNYPKQNTLNMNRNSKKSVSYIPQHSSVSSSFIKSDHFRSRIDFNINEYQAGYSINNTPNTNPFFQSFYALNVKVSNLKKDHLLKNSMSSGTDGIKTKFGGSNKTKKLKSRSQAATKHLNNNNPHIDGYMIPLPHNSKQVKSLRMGTDFSIDMRFFKDLNPRSEGIMLHSSRNRKEAKDISLGRLSENQTKATGVLKKCPCSHQFKKKSEYQMSRKQKSRTNTQKEAEIATAGANLNENKQRPIKKSHSSKDKSQKSSNLLNKHKDSHLSSQPKYTNPLSQNSGKMLHVGSDFSVGVGFFKETNTKRSDIKITSTQQEDIQQRHSDSRKILNKTKGKSSRLAKCLCPIQRKTDTKLIQNVENGSTLNSKSRKALKVGSDLNIGVEFFIDKKSNRGDIKIISNQQENDVQQSYFQHSDSHEIRNKIKSKSSMKTKADTRLKGSLPSSPRHIGSQKNNKSQNKVKSIPTILKRCFCTVKNKKKSSHKVKKGKPEKVKENAKERQDKATMVKKPYGYNECPPNICVPGKCNSHKCYKFAQKGNKNLREHAVATNHPKNKSTSSDAKNKTKVLQSKTKDSKNNREPDKFKGLSDKRVVSFGSNFNLNLEFFKDQTHFLSSNLSPASTRTPEQYQVFYSSIEGSGDNRRKLNGMGKNGLDVGSCNCYIQPAKSGTKKNKKGEDSKNTNGNKNTTSVNSAVTGKGTGTKGKRVTKSDQCSPQNCEQRFKQLEQELNKTSKKKRKKLLFSSQEVENKSKMNTDQQNLSVLDRCLCLLPLTKSKKPSIQTVTNKSIKNEKQSNFKKNMKKCICVLLYKKRRKMLTPKQSTERIVDVRKKANLKHNKMPKISSTLEKKKSDSEMKTIMPYSKKKFKKLESRTKVSTKKSEKQVSNPKSKKSKLNKNNKSQLQNDDDVVICPLCRSNAQNQKPMHTCNCPQSQVGDSKSNKKKTIHSPWCPEKIGDQADPCPVCLASAKLNKKRAKQKLLHTCLCPEQKDRSIFDKKQLNTCLCPDPNHSCLCFEQIGDQSNLNNNQMSLCPICKIGLNFNIGKSGKKQKKRRDFVHPVQQQKLIKLEKKPKGKKNKELISQIDDQSDVCPCCKAKLKLGKKKLNFFDKLKCIIINLLIKKKNEKEEEKEVIEKNKKKNIKKMDKKPLFEMVVNHNNMNILNRDEVLAKLGSTGKVSKVMKKARKANKKGKTGPPLMDMLIDINKASIINSDDVLHTVYTGKKKPTGENRKRPVTPNLREVLKTSGKLNSLKCKSLGAADTLKKVTVKETKSERKAHDSKCDCCECRGRRKKRKSAGPKVAIKPRKLKPCVCGSVVCKKNWEKLKKEQRSVKSLKIKPCVCGSPICIEESQKMPDILLEAARQAQLAKEKAIQDIKDEKLYQKDRKRRKKLYSIEDRKRWEQRRKQDKRDMKQVKKYDNVPDCLLVAESLVDIGKFGGKAFCDFMRTVCRIVRHPKDGIHNVKDAIHKPTEAVKEVKESCEGMGLFSTGKRVQHRLLKMKFTKNAITKLESHPVTNYMVHMADKTPKHRMKKFKKKRYREPLDFECSLFMASLRKRPCLRVYYMCPWFYPHCVSLLGIWKQFTDILLFILAVGVWSPCIFCMELCRAMMCCCLCTG